MLHFGNSAALASFSSSLSCATSGRGPPAAARRARRAAPLRRIRFRNMFVSCRRSLDVVGNEITAENPVFRSRARKKKKKDLFRAEGFFLPKKRANLAGSLGGLFLQYAITRDTLSGEIFVVFFFSKTKSFPRFARLSFSGSRQSPHTSKSRQDGRDGFLTLAGVCFAKSERTRKKRHGRYFGGEGEREYGAVRRRTARVSRAPFAI